jgi:hypothetical protein
MRKEALINIVYSKKTGKISKEGHLQLINPFLAGCGG